MKPPAPPAFAVGRLVMVVLFWPVLFCASGSAGLVSAIGLRGSPGLAIGVGVLLASLAAGLFISAHHYRRRMDPIVTERCAVLAVLLLGTAASLPLGFTVFAIAQIGSAPPLLAIVVLAAGMIAAQLAFRWSTDEPR